MDPLNAVRPADPCSLCLSDALADETAFAR
jgi:hypothetical protein